MFVLAENFIIVNHMDNSQDNNKEWWEEDYIILNGGILIKRGRITPGSLIGHEETRESLKEILQTQRQRICEELGKDSSFEEFLEEKHAEDYQGVDDDMPDDFNNWLSELESDYFIEYGDEYRKQILTKAIKKIKDK